MTSAITTTTTQGLPIGVRAVRREFEGGVIALDGIDLDVPAGQFIALLGPSGCGKSTLLRLVAGLDRADGGAVTIGDKAGGSAKPQAASRGARADVAYVFQDAHLLPWRNVLRNAVLPLELMGVAKSERLDAARAMLERVGLGDALRRYPAQLSGGMRMRVSLARALVTRPKLLLLDEPFAALDEITRQHLDEQLYELWAERRITVVFVTHSTSEAVYLAQRAVVFSKRPARIVLDHAIDLPAQRPKQLRGSAEFARQTAVLYDALARGEA